MSYSEITLTEHDPVELSYDDDGLHQNFSYELELKIETAFDTFLENLNINELTFHWDTFQIKLMNALDEGILQQQLKNIALSSKEPITFFLQKNNINQIIAFGIQQTNFVVNLQELIPQIEQSYSTLEINHDINQVRDYISSQKSIEACLAMIGEFNQKWDGKFSFECVLDDKSNAPKGKNSLSYTVTDAHGKLHATQTIIIKAKTWPETTLCQSYEIAGGFFSQKNMLTCAAGVAAVAGVATTLYAVSK